MKEWIPRKLRPLIGNWVYGCDVCQVVCPFNRFARPSVEAAFRPESIDAAAPPLLDLLALDEQAFAARFQGSPILRIKWHRLIRNAAVAAGNWGSDEAVPVLLPLLATENVLVRGHVAWALGRIGSREAIAGLRAALRRETDAKVREEIALALAR